MTTLRNVFKHRGGMQDLLIGRVTTSQTRAGTAYDIMALDIPYPVATTVEMQALDVAQFHRARVYASANNYTDYIYDATDGTGISSDTGPGTWLVCPESSSVLSVESKPDLRNETPAYNYQIAIVFGGSAKLTGTGGIYFYDDSDTTSADDGDNVLVTGAGERWLKIELDAATTITAVEDSGAVNLITISIGATAYPDDLVVWFKANNSNTGACTINLDGIGARALTYEDGSALDAGALVANQMYAVRFTNSPDTAYVINPDCSETVAEAGTNNYAKITPLRLSQVFADRVGADPLDASDTSGLITPNGVALALAQFALVNGFDVTLNGVDSDHDIDIAAGVGVDVAGTLVFTGSALTKQIDAVWAEGDAAGGMAATLTVAADTAYWIFKIAKADGTVDYGYDTNADASLLLAGASGYSYYYPIGGFVTDGSANIDFLYSLVNGENFRWIREYSATTTIPWPKGIKYIKATAIGAGGGGTETSNLAVAGGDTTITYNGTTITGGGGDRATNGLNGLGGTGTNGDLNITGGGGDKVQTDLNDECSQGGNSALGYGWGGSVANQTGQGYGGGGAGDDSLGAESAGGGGGGAAVKIFTYDAADNDISISIGAGGAGASGGGAGSDGGAILEILK